ncbi:hypothetical protein [Nonomuraea wenchangensis]|nr:hypothetical protein [Nonomuraea wenchangensis]
MTWLLSCSKQLSDPIQPSDDVSTSVLDLFTMMDMGKSQKAGEGESQKRRQPAKSEQANPDPAQPSAEELRIRRRLGEIASQRAAAEKLGRKLKVTQEERELRAGQGKFMRIRAKTPGTPEYRNRQHQREAAQTDEAIWNTAHDPETFNSDDW